MGVETTDGNKSYKSIFNSTTAMEGLSPTAPTPPGYTIDRYSTSGVLQETTTRTDLTTTETLTTAGYYVVTCNGPVTFDMWAWGGGGARGGGPGPGGGAAGGGVRGRQSFAAGDTLTILVAATADGIASPAPVGAWPDGGGYTTPRYEGAGGGSSRIGPGTIPYPTINDPSSYYCLIGGGGGGGTDYLTTGTYGGQGGYPSGQPGGVYYPNDPNVFGGGGTQSAGGAAGPAGRRPAGAAGSKYAGGRGGTLDGGGGGGGGYYGGGGAGGYYGQGGGGSSYINGVTNSASFDASPGSTTHHTAVDDPANPGIKPATAGDRDNGGVVVLKPVT